MTAIATFSCAAKLAAPGYRVAAMLFVALLPLAAQTVHREVLDNGVTLIVDDRALTHAVELRAFVTAGPSFEGELLGSGVSGVVMRILTDAVRAGRIAGHAELQAADRLRARLSAGATSFSLTTSDRFVEPGLHLLAGVLSHRDYDAAAVVQARELTLQDLKAAGDNAVAVERQAVLSTVLREHPARLPLLGLTEQLGTLDLDSVRRYHRSRYSAPNTTVVVVGNVDVERVRAQVRSAFAALPVSGWDYADTADEPPQFQDRHHVTAGPALQERHVYAWRVCSPEQRDHAVIAVIAHLLADPRTSALARAFQDDQLAADCAAVLDAEPDQPSILRLSYNPFPERGAAAWLAVQQVLDQLASAGPGEDQLTAAKRLLLRERIAAQSGVAAIAADLERWERMVGVPTYGEQFLDAVATVTVADVQRVAGSWLHPNGRNRSKVVIRPLGSESASESAEERGLTLADVPPQIEEVASGLRVLYRRLPIGLAHVQITIAGGAASDRPGHAGETALLARLLVEGADDLTGDALQQALAVKGMTLSSRTDVHMTELSLTCFPDDVGVGMAVLVSIVSRAALPDEDIARLKQATLAELAMAKHGGDWDAVVLRATHQSVLGDHYAAAPLFGTRETLADIDREALLDHLQASAVGKRMVMSLYGEFDAAYALGELRRLLSQDPVIPAGTAWQPEGLPWPDSAPPSVTTLTWDRQASAVALAWPGPPVEALGEDGAALDVVTALLAGYQGSSGRIGRALGEDQLPVQDLQVSVESFQARGLWSVRALMPESRREAVTAALREAVARLEQELAVEGVAVSDAELDAAKASCVVGRVLALEDQRAALSVHARALLLRGGLEQDLAYEKRVLAVTRSDLLRVMRSYLSQAPAEIRLVNLAAAQPAPASESAASPAPADAPEQPVPAPEPQP
ncbi:MAG: insulinase family protein [Planctomycetota bacterium]|nr:insulinase family protein [Planctomycetota bacterium]